MQPIKCMYFQSRLQDAYKVSNFQRIQTLRKECIVMCCAYIWNDALLPALMLWCTTEPQNNIICFCWTIHTSGVLSISPPFFWYLWSWFRLRWSWLALTSHLEIIEGEQLSQPPHDTGSWMQHDVLKCLRQRRLPSFAENDLCKQSQQKSTGIGV